VAKSAEERFDILVEAIENLSKVSHQFADSGVWQQTEVKALSQLVTSAGNALYILDPDRAAKYVQGKYDGLSDSNKTAVNKMVSAETGGIGQYL